MPTIAPSKRRDLPTLAYFRTNRQMPILCMYACLRVMQHLLDPDHDLRYL
jgi:hypothetical protein